MRLTVENLGPVVSADIAFADLTLLVGPQATGKSLFLQTLKLAFDFPVIKKELKRFGFVWNSVSPGLIELVYGEGTASVWNAATRVTLNDKVVDLGRNPKNASKEERIFYIPAQRVMTLKSGWPRPFTDYESGDPYALKHFSEQLRLMMETGLGQGSGEEGSNVFPHSRRIKSQLKQAIEDSVYQAGNIKVDADRRKRLMLKVGDSNLPFMTWSAGQREFLPLLLGMYYLLPPGKHTKRTDVDLVVIEEPEMGLHPKAIQAFMLLVFELISRDYKVAISTHSPVLLELAWVLAAMREAKAGPDELLQLFQLKPSAAVRAIFEKVITARVGVHSFSRAADGSVRSRDISSLDAGAADEATADWGGLTSFASRASDIVSSLMSQI